MILIISQNGGTVNKVIDWMLSMNIVVHRLDPNHDKINVKLIELSKKNVEILLEIEAYGITTKLSDYSGIWIWHSNLWFNVRRQTNLDFS